MADSFKIQGLEPVLAKMKGLAPGLVKKGLRAAARKGMIPVRDAARKNTARWDDPETKASNIPKKIAISESAKQGRKEGGVVMRVGVRGGARLNKDPANTGHWRLQELGWSGHAARPALRPALANNIDRVTTTVVAALGPEIDKQIAKDGK